MWTMGCNRQKFSLKVFVCVCVCACMCVHTYVVAKWPYRTLAGTPAMDAGALTWFLGSAPHKTHYNESINWPSTHT